MKLKDYQLKPALQGVGAARTRILIADAVGLGKTLEVSILVTELIQRGREKEYWWSPKKVCFPSFKRILDPIHHSSRPPRFRWYREGPQPNSANYNPFNYYERSIISMDTLKDNLEYRNYLEKTWWDIIIIDECHTSL